VPVNEFVSTALTMLDDDELAARYEPGAPEWLRVNFVSSVDGAVTVDGASAGLSGIADKRVFGILRMRCHALMVGAGTLRREEYGPVRLDEERRAWRRAHGLREYPTLVVVSHTLNLSPEQSVFAEAPIRPLIITHESAPAERRAALQPVADVLTFGEHEVDLAAAVAALHVRGLTEILCEGGPHLFGSLTAANLVDEVCLTVSPLLVGAGTGRITAGGSVDNEQTRLRLRHVLTSNDVLLLRYDRAR
jgi:riboflavin biosynthesis pyrimidine reductase